MIVIKDPKKSSFNFGFLEDVDGNLKRKIEFIAKSNESLTENKIKNEIEQFLLKYQHGNKIYEHVKQQNEWTS